MAKNITIYDAILNVISAWHLVQKETILKCFAYCGIVPALAEDSRESDNPDDQFDTTPDPQIEAMEREAPARAPDACSYNGDGEVEVDPTPEPLISNEEALDALRKVKKLCVGESKLLELAEAL